MRASPAIPPESTPTTQGDTPFLILQLYEQFRRVSERTLEEVGLPRHVAGMGNILYALFDLDGQGIKELHQRTGLAYATLSNLLDRLEAERLVTRRHDPDDGRASRVWLTAKGRNRQERLEHRHARTLEIMHANFSNAEVRQMKHLMSVLLETMRADNARHATPRANKRHP